MLATTSDNVFNTIGEVRGVRKARYDSDNVAALLSCLGFHPQAPEQKEIKGGKKHDTA
jgi:transposase